MSLLDITEQAVKLFLSPVNHCLLFFAFAFFMGRVLKWKGWEKVIATLTFIWFLFCISPYTSMLLLHPLEHHYPYIKSDSREMRGAEAIVVLACFFYEDESAPFVNHWPECSLKRNLQASLVYRNHELPIYLAGGKWLNSQASHAEMNAKFMEKMGIPKSRLNIVPQGYNTKTESESLRPHLKGKTIVLVTSASHMIRAKRYFEELDIRVIPIPVEHHTPANLTPFFAFPSGSSLTRSERAIYEYLALTRQYFQLNG